MPYRALFEWPIARRDGGRAMFPRRRSSTLHEFPPPPRRTRDEAPMSSLSLLVASMLLLAPSSAAHENMEAPRPDRVSTNGAPSSLVAAIHRAHLIATDGDTSD